DERHLANNSLEEIWSHVADRADQQTTGAATLDNQSITRSVLRLHQVIGAGNEVGERIHFVHHSACLSPLFTQLAAPTDVADHKDDAAVQQTEPARRK